MIKGTVFSEAFCCLYCQFRKIKFSNPQQTQAKRTNTDPKENRIESAFSRDSKIQEIVMMQIAATSFFPAFSWNKATAMTVVATISKLFSSDTLSGADVLRPRRRK